MLQKTEMICPTPRVQSLQMIHGSGQIVSMSLMMTAFNSLVDVLFGVDIIINFLSAYESNN